MDMNLSKTLQAIWFMIEQGLIHLQVAIIELGLLLLEVAIIDQDLDLLQAAIIDLDQHHHLEGITEIALNQITNIFW